MDALDQIEQQPGPDPRSETEQQVESLPAPEEAVPLEQPEAVLRSEPLAEPVPEPEPVPHSEPALVPKPEPTPEPEPLPQPAPESQPEPQATSAPEPPHPPPQPKPARPKTAERPPAPPSFIVRFRPTGPWRFGPDSGVREQVDLLFHSDAVYSAVTNAMARLGLLQHWLIETAENENGSPVRFSSLYPYQRDTLFVVPPRGVWPPPPSPKIRYKGAQFVPVKVIDSLLNEKPLDEDRWQVDGESNCLIPSGWHDGPFRTSIRSNVSVDRIDQGAIEVHRTSCLEFSRDSGLWMLVVFENKAAQSQWERPIRSALRWLADSGIGGERSRGWGRSLDPKWERAEALATHNAPENAEMAYWLLSLYLPAEADGVDWNRGNYSTINRTGRTESVVRHGELKAASLMIAEGSVVLAGRTPSGAVRDVAPEGFPHPVYRAGFAVTVPIPWRVPA